MLKKVLKYDLKEIGKKLLPIYLVTLGSCLVTRLLYILAENIPIFRILSFLTNILALASLVATIVISFTTCVKRFYTNLFKEEGYLTNVLPVKINTHILSKFISFACFSLISIVIFLGSFSLMYYSIELVSSLREAIDVIKKMIVPFIVFLSAVYLSYQLLLCAAYSFGQKSNSNKMRKAFIAGIVIYIATQLVSLITIFIMNATNSDFLKLVSASDVNSIQKLITTFIFIYIVYILAYYKIIIYNLNKKMDIE